MIQSDSQKINTTGYLTLRAICELLNLNYSTAENSVQKKGINADILIGTTGYYSRATANKIIEHLQENFLIEILNDGNKTSSQSKFIKDITGEKYGRLTAIRLLDEKTPKGGAIWLWQCDCGKLIIIPLNTVAHTKSRDKKSCGCIRKEQYSKLDRFLGVHNVEGTCVERIMSSKPNKNNKSGVKGVFWDKSRNQWHAKIKFKYKDYDLGRFYDKNEAIKIRREAEKNLYGTFLKWYFQLTK